MVVQDKDIDGFKKTKVGVPQGSFIGPTLIKNVFDLKSKKAT